MTKSQYLNLICREDILIEYRPFKGWYATFEDGARYFGDEGEYLGEDYDAAYDTLWRMDMLKGDKAEQLASAVCRYSLHLLDESKGITLMDKARGAIAYMAYEEICYWSSKTTTKRGVKSCRVLFAI